MKNINVKVMDWKDVYFYLFFADRDGWEEDFFQPIEKIRKESDFPDLDICNFIVDMVAKNEIPGIEVIPPEMLRLLGLDDEGAYFIET